MSRIVSAVRFCLCRGVQSFAAVSIVSACFASGQLMRLTKSNNTLKVAIEFDAVTCSHIDGLIMSSYPAAFVACHRLLLHVETHKSRCISLGGIADVEGGLWRSITMERRLHFASCTSTLQHWKLFKTALGSSQHQCLRATSVERFKCSPFGCLMA